MIDSSYIDGLNGKETFSKKDVLASFRSGGYSLSEASFEKKFASLVESGEIARVGRGIYSLPKTPSAPYKYEYSDFAKEVASYLISQYPAIDFSLEELLQLNEFGNHFLTHNAIFLSVEGDCEEFVFEALRSRYFGKVLLDPDLSEYDRYKSDGVVIVNRLVTESPREKKGRYRARLEKLLVDLIADPLISKLVSQSEYPEIYDNAFFSCPIDESSLFRYAKRRSVYDEIMKMIEEDTEINLRTVK